MIWLIGLLIFGGITGWGIWRVANDESGGDGETIAIVFGGIGLFCFLLIVGMWTIANHAGLARWEAFYEINTVNYQITVDKTASYLSQEEFADVLVQGSVERFEQAGFVSERIAEWRDAVNEYNLTITSMKYFDRLPLTGCMMPDNVQSMKLLVIK